MRISLPVAILIALAAGAFAGPPEAAVRPFERQARRSFPGGEVLAACSLRLEPGGFDSHAAVIFLPSNEDDSRGIFGGKGRRFRVRTVSRRQADEGDRQDQELQCLGPEEVGARNKAISETETVSGEIRPRFGLGVFCHSDAEPGFSCYEYDPAEKKFIEAGGWST